MPTRVPRNLTMAHVLDGLTGVVRLRACCHKHVVVAGMEVHPHLSNRESRLGGFKYGESEVSQACFTIAHPILRPRITTLWYLAPQNLKPTFLCSGFVEMLIHSLFLNFGMWWYHDLGSEIYIMLRRRISFRGSQHCHMMEDIRTSCF